MSFLLDTHVVLWWLMDDDELSEEVKLLIDTEPDVFLSPASLWEIRIKEALGELTVPEDLLETIASSDLRELPILFAHAHEAGGLPLHHRDPFDRMLVAQARCEGLILLSRDPLVQKYDVSVRPV